MSLVEKDLFRWFWELDPWATALLVILAGPVMIYLIEVIRWQMDSTTKPPWGLNITRYSVVLLGDMVFVAFAIYIVNVFYDQVRVDESFLTSQAFSLFCLLGGVLLAAGFIWMEEQSNSYPVDKFNLNRIWHTPYFALMYTLMLGAAFRLGWYGLIKGQERGLAILVVLAVIGYFGTIAIDMLKLNPVWKWVQNTWPNQTTYP